MPSINDRLHERLLADVDEFFTAMGFVVDELTYHDNMNPEFVELIKNNQTLQSHVLRTSSDRVATNGHHVIWYDAKTCSWPAGNDFAIEAVPYLRAWHLQELFGCTYLFCCRRHDGTEYGITPQFHERQRIMVPGDRIDQPSWGQLIDACPFAPDVTSCAPNGGSGDIFFPLPVDSWNLPDWRNRILQLIEPIGGF